MKPDCRRPTGEATPLLLVSRGNKGVRSEIVVSRGNNRVSVAGQSESGRGKLEKRGAQDRQAAGVFEG
jgi:hypothetical protein